MVRSCFWIPALLVIGAISTADSPLMDAALPPEAESRLRSLNRASAAGAVTEGLWGIIFTCAEAPGHERERRVCQD